MEKRYQVFVSSTFEDLREERSTVITLLLQMDCFPAGMELFPAADDDSWTVIKNVIDDSDYYIVIVGGRYGSVGAEGKSYTQLEFEYAERSGKPIIALVHSDPRALPVGKSETSRRGLKQLADFRTQLKARNCRYWTNLTDLVAAVMTGIGHLKKTRPGSGWIRSEESSGGLKDKVMSDALTISSARISHTSVSKWIEYSSEAPDKYKFIAFSALTKCYGTHSSDENSYLKYVVENLIETHAKYEAITRHNYNVSVVIRKIKECPDLLQWEERKDYILKCPAGKSATPIGTMISARANFDNVERLVELLNITIAIDGKPWFSFQKWKREAGEIDMSGVFNIEADGGKLSFDGKWMYFKYFKTAELTRPETRITVVEVSFITGDERAYSFITTLPSYNVSLTMRLEGLPNWQLQKPNIGTTWYHAGSSEFASFVVNNPQWVSASVPKWVLPGVWATVEWAPE